MATYKYDIFAISADIQKLKALIEKPVGVLVVNTQNTGDVITKVRDEIVPKLNELDTTIRVLIATTAAVTQEALNQMIELDDDFKEIIEEGETIETLYVKIED